MIEVLRKGPGLRQITCNKCQSLLQYDEKCDTQEKVQLGKTMEYIICPECKSVNIVRWRKE